MNGETFIFLAIPAAVAALLIWMIAAGYGKTDGMPVDNTPSPYPARLDLIGRWVVGIATVILYFIIASSLGFRAAAIAFGIFLLIDAAGALVWTVGQELLARRARTGLPFGTRLLRNFRDFYANVVVGIIAYG